jgi:hypothetical protein
MSFFFSKRKQRETELGIVYGGIALIALLAARFLPVLEIAPSCAFKALTGFPCPTCGSTRSLVHLAHTDFSAAFAMNPLICSAFFIGVFSLLYGIPASFFRLPKLTVRLTDLEKGTIRAVAVTAVLINWLYLIFSL